jgi:hypothetical protein
MLSGRVSDLRVKVLKNWRSDNKLMQRLATGFPKTTQ